MQKMFFFASVDASGLLTSNNGTNVGNTSGTSQSTGVVHGNYAPVVFIKTDSKRTLIDSFNIHTFFCN